MLTMVNDARIALRKSPIGFINPLVGVSFSVERRRALTIDYRSMPPTFLTASTISLTALTLVAARLDSTRAVVGTL